MRKKRERRRRGKEKERKRKKEREKEREKKKKRKRDEKLVHQLVLFFLFISFHFKSSFCLGSFLFFLFSFSF